MGYPVFSRGCVPLSLSLSRNRKLSKVSSVSRETARVRQTATATEKERDRKRRIRARTRANPRRRSCGTHYMFAYICGTASLPKEYRIKRFPGKSTVWVTMETIAGPVFRFSTRRRPHSRTDSTSDRNRIASDVSSNIPIYGFADF